MKYSGTIIFFCALYVICCGHFRGLCQASEGAEPAGVNPSNVVGEAGFKKNAGVWFASFFRDVISPVDGDRCPSLPSCSSYSVNAFEKHGFFAGWLMTVDRLIHEGDEGSVSPKVYHNGRLRILDPVENNDFWWFSEDEPTH